LATDPTAASGFIGHAGEHYVLYQLYRRGLLAALSPRGAPTVDVLVLAPDESVLASLQVKTKTKKEGWVMGKKHVRLVAPHLFYAFVDLKPDDPVTYIVPSSVVADVLHLEHQAYIDTPGRGGRQRRDSTMYELRNAYRHSVPGYPDGWLEAYRERWDLLANGGEALPRQATDRPIS